VTEQPSPSPLPDRLAALRAAADLTGFELGTQLGWGPPTVSKVESGRRGISPAETRRWAQACGASEETVEELAGLAEKDEAARAEQTREKLRASAARPRAARGKHLTPVGYQRLYVKASRVRHVAASRLPLLVATPGYNRLLAGGGGEADDGFDEMALITAGRMLHEPGRQVEVLLGEQTVCWQPADRMVMRGQLDRLVGLVGLDTVRLAVLPLTADVQPLHGFDLLDGAVVVEAYDGLRLLTAADDVAVYEQVWERLRGAAVDGEDARRILVDAAIKLDPMGDA
jgi:transcriptional regulator with XRE-family HTH domain